MDTRRMHVLEDKAATVGLSDAEATELGHMYAEFEGKPYSDHMAEQVARAARDHPMQERKERARRWPLNLFDRRFGTKSHMLEIGQTANAPEEAGRRA